MYESDVWYFKFKPIQKCMFPVSCHAIQLSNVSIFVQFLNCGSVSFGRAVTTNFYWFFLSSISCERCNSMQFLHTICYMHEKSYLDPFFGQCFSIRHHQQYPIRHGNSVGVTWIGPSEHSMKSQQLNMFMAFARLAHRDSLLNAFIGICFSHWIFISKQKEEIVQLLSIHRLYGTIFI